MERALVALFVPALIYTPFFGGMLMFALPVMLTLTVVIGIPLLYFLKATTTMRWWQCVGAGVLTTSPFIVPFLDDLFRPTSGTHFFLCMAFSLGVLGGWLFWLIGVYGNPVFPAASASARKESLSVLPLLLLLWGYYAMVQPERQVACVLDTQLSPPSGNAYAYATVRLPNQQRVDVPLSRGDFGDDPKGLCASIAVRRNWSLNNQVYDYKGLLPGTCGKGCN